MSVKKLSSSEVIALKTSHKFYFSFINNDEFLFHSKVAVYNYIITLAENIVEHFLELPSINYVQYL